MTSDPLESRTAPISEEDAAALRRNVRKRVLWAAKLACGAKRYDCVVVDLSLGGARIHLSEPVTKGEIVTLKLDRLGPLRAEVVWQEEQSIGLRFVDDAKTIADVIGDRLPLVTPIPAAKSA
jgi:PilZ domain